MNHHSFRRKFFAFFVCLLTVTLFLSTEGTRQVSAAVNARFDNGKLKFSVNATAGATSGWRYKTVGFVISREKSSSRTPMNLKDKTEMITFSSEKQTPTNASSGQSVTVHFEIKQSLVESALKKKGANLADIAEKGGRSYLHAMFQLIPPGKTKPVSGSKVYKSYAEISTAKAWTKATKESLKDYYNISANYDGNPPKEVAPTPAPGKVTVRHFDKDTGNLIHSEAAKSQAVGATITYSPKARGYFKKGAQPYVPFPANQSISYKMPNPAQTKTIDFYYRATVPNPSGEREAWYATEAAVSGDIYWRLKKEDATKESNVIAQNNANQSGTHYQTRNHSKSIVASGFPNQTDSGTYPAEDIKGEKITFHYSYEYTNWFYETYIPLEYIGSDVFKWTLSKTEPLWSKGATFKFSQALTAEHRQGEAIELSPGSASYSSLIGQSLVIGEEIKKQFETFDLGARSEKKLPAQTKLAIMDQPIQYQNDFKERLSMIQGEKLFLPADLEPYLQEKYSDNISEHIVAGDYGIPLEFGTITLKNGRYELPYRTKEDFYITRNTGFVVPVEKNTPIVEATATAASAYQSFTGTVLDEESDILLADLETQNSVYYLPIDSDSSLEPKKTYNNHYVLGKMGLNDLTFIFSQPFSFEKYLVGSVFDEVQVNEEVVPVLDVSYAHTITLDESQQRKVQAVAKDRTALMHGFRVTDTKDIHEQLKKHIALERNDSDITKEYAQLVTFKPSSNPTPEKAITIPNLKQVVSVHIDNGEVDFDVEDETIRIKPTHGIPETEEVLEIKEVEKYLDTEPGEDANFLPDSFEEDDDEGFSGSFTRSGAPVLINGEYDANGSSKLVRLQRAGEVSLRHQFEKKSDNTDETELNQEHQKWPFRTGIDTEPIPEESSPEPESELELELESNSGNWLSWRDGYLPNLLDYQQDGFSGTLFPISDDIQEKDGEVWFANHSETDEPPESTTATITYEGTVVSPPKDTRVWRQNYTGILSKINTVTNYAYTVTIVYEVN